LEFCYPKEKNCSLAAPERVNKCVVMGVVCYGTMKSIEIRVVCISQGSQGKEKFGGFWKLQEPPGNTMVVARRNIRICEKWVYVRH